MFAGQLILKQVMDYMPLPIFRRCVAKYQGDHRVRKFSCLDQFLCMAFAQITYRESLRDIEVCLRSQQKKLYHMGIRGKVSKSTLADANEIGDWRIYAELAQSLIALDFVLSASVKAEKRVQAIRKKLDKRTCGYQRRLEAITKSTENLDTLVKGALNFGIKAEYILMDSWFCWPAILARLGSLFSNLLQQRYNSVFQIALY